MPPNAKLAFKGKIFEVWQWEQELFDGSTATFERLKRPDTATVIPVVGDKILLLDEQQPGTDVFLSFPGGRCDEGEDPLVAGKRELMEETGYESAEWELWSDAQPSGKIEWTMYTYIARDCTKTGELALDPGERVTPRFLSFDELLELPDKPDFRQWFMVPALLRARYEPEAREKLRQQLFG
jgi:8-oxo-dGTP pyrophosphatase MutT (NUDIX family)